ncbi:jg8097, partial [Pararge aegeria aegeria]
MHTCIEKYWTLTLKLDFVARKRFVQCATGPDEWSDPAGDRRGSIRLRPGGGSSLRPQHHRLPEGDPHFTALYRDPLSVLHLGLHLRHARPPVLSAGLHARRIRAFLSVEYCHQLVTAGPHKVLLRLL